MDENHTNSDMDILDTTVPQTLVKDAMGLETVYSDPEETMTEFLLHMQSKDPGTQWLIESKGMHPKDRVDEIQGAWSHIAGLLEKSKEAMAKQYDKHHIDKSFRISDEVYLQAKNIKTIRPNVKLDHWQLGPFTIIDIVGK